MRDFPLPKAATCSVIAALVLSAVPLASTPVLAQTHGDQRALEALGPAHGAHHATTHARHSAAHHAHAASSTTPPATQPAKTATASIGPTPPIPAAPPAPAVIKPPAIDVPLHPEPPPPPVPVVASAAGSSSAIKGGERITFGDNSADLNAATMQALQSFATQLKADPAARAQIDAYSNGSPDDPSTPRRTSLERGLAARAVLINSGIPSTRIYVRVIGRPHDSDGPADRVDLTRSDVTEQAAARPAAATSSTSGSASVKAASAP